MGANRFLITICIAVALVDILMGFKFTGPWAAFASLMAFNAGLRIR